MKIGMLWFDNDSHSDLESKVEKAAAYYRLKYGKTPSVCFVHPSMLPPAQEAQPQEPKAAPSNLKEHSNVENSSSGETYLLVAGVEVRSNSAVRPYHFWIGVNGIDPVNSTTRTSIERSAGISPDLTLSSASSRQ